MVSPDGRITASAILYPMYVISVPDLLELAHMLPHQELLRRGKLRMWDESMRGSTIFVSHQWLAYTEPDPDGEQLGVLQRVLTRLSEGELEVQNSWMQQSLFPNNRARISKAQWRVIIPTFHIWIDYLSMAKPTAGPMPVILST